MAQSLKLIPLEIFDKIWLMLLKESVEDVFAFIPTCFQGTTEECPHPLLRGWENHDLIIFFLVDYTLCPEIIHDWA